MHNTSIYKEHYHGETDRAGVAYLRARSTKDDRAPRRIGTYPLDVQRQIIARAARTARTIIVAEFIEYGDRTPGFRPAFTAAVTFTSETQVQDLFVARDEYLTRRREDYPFLMRYLTDNGITLTAAYDRHRRQ